jgi:hypothetical protein
MLHLMESNPNFTYTLGCRLTTGRTYDDKKKYTMDPIVERFSKVERIIKDAVCCYREIYEEKKRNKLFKKSSACSSSRKHLLPEPKDMILICTVQYR